MAARIKNLNFRFLSDIMFEMGAHHPTEHRNINFFVCTSIFKVTAGSKVKKVKTGSRIIFQVFRLDSYRFWVTESEYDFRFALRRILTSQWRHEHVSLFLCLKWLSTCQLTYYRPFIGIDSQALYAICLLLCMCKGALNLLHCHLIFSKIFDELRGGSAPLRESPRNTVLGEGRAEKKSFFFS